MKGLESECRCRRISQDSAIRLGTPQQNPTSITGWWFDCHQFYFPRNIGLLIIPIDELQSFSEGLRKTTKQIKKNDDTMMIEIDQPWDFRVLDIFRAILIHWNDFFQSRIFEIYWSKKTHEISSFHCLWGLYIYIQYIYTFLSLSLSLSHWFNTCIYMYILYIVHTVESDRYWLMTNILNLVDRSRECNFWGMLFPSRWVRWTTRKWWHPLDPSGNILQQKYLPLRWLSHGHSSSKIFYHAVMKWGWFFVVKMPNCLKNALPVWWAKNMTGTHFPW